jgi:hypothetical protein
MLGTISVALLAFWLLGVAAAYSSGGFIHVLLALAVVAILIKVLRGPKDRTLIVESIRQ